MMEALLQYPLCCDFGLHLWCKVVTFGSSLCVCMSSSLSVLLVPLQELQIEGRYTSIVVGCALISPPSTVGVTVFHCIVCSVYCKSSKHL